MPGGDVDVGGIDIVLCFDGPAPPRVIPEHPGAAPYLMDMPVAVDAAGRVLGVLAVDERGIDTTRLPKGACVGFVVDVESAAKALDSQALAEVVGRDLLLSPDVWLWRPDPWPAHVDHGALVVETDNSIENDVDDLQLAVPFPIDSTTGGWVVPATTFALQSWSAVGRLRARTTVVTRQRTIVTVSALGDVGEGIDSATLKAWLEVAIDDVAVVHSAFPVDRVRVFVIPRPGTRAVLGGFLGRGGGASALFHVGTGPLRIDADTAVDDDGRWVLTHELAHALLPPVRLGDAWLNEGFTTWQQEHLPVLAGRRAVDVANAEVAIGLRTGRRRADADQLTLERACTEMAERHSYQHCYWGGAALAVLLAADVGDDGVFALIRALGKSRPFDASPQPALTLLQAVTTSSSDPLARRAATALVALWQQHKNAPFPVIADAAEVDGFVWPNDSAVDDMVDNEASHTPVPIVQ